MAKPSRVLLGEIGSAHGIKGEVVVRSYTANPDDIGAYGILETKDGAPLPKFKVVRVSSRGVICRFDGIADRTAAERLRGIELWIARDRLPPAAGNEFYHADLIGLAAVSPEGQVLGTIVEVANFGAGDLIEVRLDGTTRTEYVPFTDAFVPHVDIAAGRATVVMPFAGDDPDDDELAAAGLETPD
jgi:16S rRNA processing protein RimM